MSHRTIRVKSAVFLIVCAICACLWHFKTELRLINIQVTEEQVFDEYFPMLQNDSKLLTYIRDNYLIPPSTKPYNLVSPQGNPSEKEGQNKYILQILNNMTGGFFVESGAWDGENLSNTLLLERDYKWSGLLVEPNKKSFETLISKNRKAWSANVCLSPDSHPKFVTFGGTKGNPIGWYSELSKNKESKVKNIHESVNTPCFPVFSLLKALEITTVDFFSLDIEGSEMDVLATIPFDSILIKTFTIEWNHVKGGKTVLRDYVESKGYKMVKDTSKGSSADYIFAHKSVPIPKSFH